MQPTAAMRSAVVSRLRSRRERVRSTDIAAGSRQLLSRRRLLVIEKHARHPLRWIRKVLGQRIERRRQLDRLLRREVVRWYARTVENGQIGDAAVTLNGEADGHHSLQPGLDEL